MAGVKRSLGSMLGHDHLGHRSHGHEDAGSTVRNQRTRASRMIESSEPATRTPSPTFPPLNNTATDFRANASIVLVGIRGAGKSTLAIMASSAMKRKVIDLESSFQKAYGMSSASYKKFNGTEPCHRQQAEILKSVLERSKTDCVIVCSWMERRVQALLRDFAATNPVIHILRDADAIREHLKIQDPDKARHMLSVSRVIFRACTNLEFFNVSERAAGGLDSPSADPLIKRLPVPYLALKHAERHWLKFLSLIFPPGAIPFIESAFPLALVPTEEREFTYTVSMALPDILEPGYEVEDYVEGADVVQIVVKDLYEQDKDRLHDNFEELADHITQGVGVARRGTVLPLAVHIKLPHSLHDDKLQIYLRLVTHALRLAPEMVTVDLRLGESAISQLVSAKGHSKIIGQYHAITEPPPWDSKTWSTLYQKAVTLGCDIARLTRKAASMDDNFAAADFRASIRSSNCRQIPLAAYNTGSLGRHSASFNPVLTTVTTTRAEADETLVERQHCLTPRLATRALCSAYAYDSMKLYVFGVHVSYSVSPAMHNSAVEALGLPHHYEPYSTQSLSSIKHLIEDPYFGGASIGLPFKVEVITLIHSLSRHARAIGAVNTLIPVRQLKPDGSLPDGAEFFKGMGRAGPVKALYGENTDWIGIRACIRRGLSPANAVRPGTTGFLAGAGGMARAALYAMLQVGIQNIVIYNRTTANANTLATHFGQLLQNEDFQSLGAGRRTRFEVLESMDQPWPAHFNLPTIVISCLPTHKIGNTPSPDWTMREEWLGNRTGGVIIELGYKTLNTPLLQQAKQHAPRGWVAMTGLDLLPEQGFAQFELFSGKRAPRKVMRNNLMKAYRSEEGSPHEALQPLEASRALPTWP